MGGIYIKNKWLPYLLILPTIVLICVFKIYPIIDSVIQGVLSTEGSFTLDNYKLLFADKTFWSSLWVTLEFNVIIIPLQIIIAFIMAMMVNVKVRGIEIFRTVFYLPFCISLTIATVIWQMMLNVNNGVVNSVLGILGISPVGFLIDKKWALLSIVLIASWRGCAYWMMFILAGLKGI
ncbi:sugar ABC transporter permease, partial [Blautia pseudococcoides]|nr:sugar ABC transporter permease [Blautia pseudococcoides]